MFIDRHLFLKSSSIGRTGAYWQLSQDGTCPIQWLVIPPSLGNIAQLSIFGHSSWSSFIHVGYKWTMQVSSPCLRYHGQCSNWDARPALLHHIIRSLRFVDRRSTLNNIGRVAWHPSYFKVSFEPVQEFVLFWRSSRSVPVAACPIDFRQVSSQHSLLRWSIHKNVPSHPSVCFRVIGMCIFWLAEPTARAVLCFQACRFFLHFNESLLNLKDKHWEERS
jgi:hypothetical protein